MLADLWAEGAPDFVSLSFKVIRFSGMIYRYREHKNKTLMATIIPALGSCVSRMTAGERRTAERLEQKLDADKQTWAIHGDLGPKTIANPLEQARQCA